MDGHAGQATVFRTRREDVGRVASDGADQVGGNTSSGAGVPHSARSKDWEGQPLIFTVDRETELSTLDLSAIQAFYSPF